MSTVGTITEDPQSNTGNDGPIPSPIIIPSHAVFNYYGRPGPPKYNEVSLFIHVGDDAQPVLVPITDIRPRIDTYNLDQHGFQILKDTYHPPESPDRSDGFSLKIHGQAELAANEAQPKRWYKSTSTTYSDYYPHTYSLVSEKLGAKSVVLSAFIVRDAVAYDSVKVTSYLKGSQGPAPRPHIDYSSSGGRAFLRNMLPDFFAQRDREMGRSDSEIDAFLAHRTAVLEAEDRCAKAAGVAIKDWDGMNYDGPRWGIISVWRPLEPVRRDPLAMMDISTALPEDDFVPVPRWYDSFEGYKTGFESENVAIRPPPPMSEGETKPRHKWHWVSGQQPDEVTLIKLFDSDTVKNGGTISSGTPHCGFAIQGTEKEVARKSIEVRAHVFW